MTRQTEEVTDNALGTELTGVVTKFGPDNPARILPLISGSRDRELLSEWISNQPGYEVVDPQPKSTTLTAAEFDLCILDQSALQTYVDELQSRKEAEAPVLLPYLLLYPEDDPAVIEVDEGKLADTVLRDTVDEIVSLPLKKTELAWRVKALLRARSQSLQLESERRQMKRFKQAADSAGHAVYITDAEGTIEYANPAFERITGYDAEEVIGENPRILNSGEMSDEYFEDLWETVTAGERWEEEVTNERRDGTIYYAEQTIAPIVGPEGTIDSYVAIQQDITQRKRGRRKLEQYKQAVESAIDLLAAVDTDLEFLFANQKYCEYHGVEPDAIDGMALPDVLDDKSFTEVEDAVNAAFAGEEKKLEIARDLPDMGERILETFLFPILDDEGEVYGVGASMRDITAQKQLEADLVESKERYESLFTSIRDAILVADTDRRIINCNPAFTELFGYELSEIEGKPTKYVYENEAEFEKLGAALEGHMDDPEFTHTVTYQKKSGQTFQGETNVFYLENADDETVGFIGVIRDISDKRDRITQLQVIDRVLRHNFKNDVNVIQGFAEHIETRGEPPLTGYAEKINETGERLLKTVEKEREATKFLSKPPAVETVDVGRVTRQVTEQISTEYPDATISTACGDEHLSEATVNIERALEELIVNSIVHAESEQPRVTVSVDSSEDYTTVVVTDENPRIPEMERKILTEEKDIDPLYHGSGLGLWLVKLIVNRSGGVLEFEENEPRGNIVKIRLPVP